jgi:hypothetical protein
MASTVTNFWIQPDPKNLPLTTKEVSFGYTDSKGNKKEYKVTRKNKLYAFHAFIHGIMIAKKKNLLPWTMSAIRAVKDEVTIVNLKDDAVQMEMDLQVTAHSVIERFQEKLPWEQ